MPLAADAEVPLRDREVLASWARSPSIRARLPQRTRIVLLAAVGLATPERLGRAPYESDRRPGCEGYVAT